MPLWWSGRSSRTRTGSERDLLEACAQTPSRLVLGELVDLALLLPRERGTARKLTKVLLNRAEDRATPATAAVAGAALLEATRLAIVDLTSPHLLLDRLEDITSHEQGMFGRDAARVCRMVFDH